VVLDARRRVQAPRSPRRHRPLARVRGSGGRAAAGAARLGNAVGAAFKDRRELEPVEARLAGTAGVALLALAVLFAVAPEVLAYPLALLLAWFGGSLLYSGYRWRWKKSKPPPDHVPPKRSP
jgi:cardiolipin synthase A/B